MSDHTDSKVKVFTTLIELKSKTFVRSPSSSRSGSEVIAKVGNYCNITIHVGTRVISTRVPYRKSGFHTAG